MLHDKVPKMMFYRWLSCTQLRSCEYLIQLNNANINEEARNAWLKVEMMEMKKCNKSKGFAQDIMEWLKLNSCS